MRYDVTLPGALLRFSIDAEGDREAVGTALRIAREHHTDVKVHEHEGGRLVADTTDDRAVPVPEDRPRAAPEGAPAGATSSPVDPNAERS